ncbi:DnaJ-domain-containing protein [Meredithblackwellia eburnea MCA 4105]
MEMDTDVDYYAILEIASDSTAQQIKTAYRQRSLKVHPDRNPDNPQAAALFHTLSHAFGVLSDPTKKAAFDSQLAARNARKLRFAALDSKRKAMAEELERGERQFKRAKEDERAEKSELERLKEEGRKMREERERRRLDGEKERAEAEKKEREEREKEEKDKINAPVELGPLDTTLKVRWDPSAFPSIASPDTLTKALATLLSSSVTASIDSIVISSKFSAHSDNPKKRKKNANAVVSFRTVSAANNVVEALNRRTEGDLTADWAAGTPPAVLNGTGGTLASETPQGAKVLSPPPLTSVRDPPPSFASSLFSNTSESATLDKLRAKEREKLMEDMKRQDEEEEARLG